MKFSHTLQFNAVREWAEYYINYQKLKHAIYDLEKIQAEIYRRGDVESRAGPELQKEEVGIVRLLDSELARIEKFYKEKESELLRDTAELTRESDPVDGEESRLLAHALPLVERQQSAAKCRNLYINLCSLKEFAVLNYTGFAKVLKKHDKVLNKDLKSTYLPAVENSYFWHANFTRASLNQAIDAITQRYAALCHHGDGNQAAVDLGRHLKEFVVWERNSIWREMVGEERRVTSAGVKRVAAPPAPKFNIRLPYIGRVPVTTQNMALVFCLAVFIVLLLSVDIFGDKSKNNCFAILVFASLMWASEALPLYVTSMTVPFLVIVTGCLVKITPDGTKLPIPANDAVKYLFGKMFAPVIMLLLGGFTIAAAVSKHHIAKRMATAILSRAGTKSSNILLAIMFVATFASMWISNVAAPVLCFSVIDPLLRTLEPGNGFAKSMVMGIALASNIGGMVTPISSPQNAIALGQMDPPVAWIPWLAVTLPISIISVLICWMMLLYFYNPSKSTPHVQPIRSSNEPLSTTQIYVLVITFITILLWLFETSIDEWVGSSGIIAMIPMIAFFGFGVLSKDDFNSFLWTVIMLAMGGISLGATVENTELLSTISAYIRDSLSNQNLFVALLAFCGLTLVIATFISHTVSALIILPLVKSVGQQLGPHANLLVLSSAIMCSGAMGLPISGFPNINAVSLEDVTGEPYVCTRDFLRVGVPASIVVFGIVSSVGYCVMLLVGF